MMMRLAGLPVSVSAVVTTVVLVLTIHVVQPAFAADNFQFMKATENRVWRLNKASGEIAVCTLQGEQLVCTTSSEAASPPPRSYAEYQAQRQANRDEEKAVRAAQEEKDMKILTRVLDFFKEMIAMSQEETAK